MRNRMFTKLLSVAVAVTALFTMSVSATAAPVADATIDMSKTASLSIYKYDITSAEADGVWNTDNYVSTGVFDQDGVNNVLGNTADEKTLPNGEVSYGYAIKGVEFTYLKLADVTTYSKDNKIATLYGFDSTGSGETMLKAIGLDWEDREREADATVDGKQIYYFTTDTLMKALSDALADNATTVKNALENYVKANGGTTMAQTDSYGYTGADALPLGLYLVVETKVPEYVTITTAPFFVSLPMTSVNGTNATDGGTRWLYNVTVYPKNATGKPDLEKTVRETLNDTGKNNGTQNNITDGYAHTATASDGDVVDYQILSTLPAISSAATYLSTYTYVDTLSRGITYNQNDVVIEFYKDAACTDKITAWELTDADPKFTVAYTGGGNEAATMTIAMTGVGLNEINTAQTVYPDDVDSGYSGCTMRITYSAKVDSDATVTYGNNGNPNEVTLTWKRTSTTYFDTLTDDCHVYTYGIDLTKQFSDSQGDFSKVTMLIHNDTDNYYVTAQLTDGVYYVTGHVAEEANATAFVPTADGKIIVKGMEDDTYTITETTTDDGYRLLKDNIEIVIKAEAGEDTCSVCLEKRLVASATLNGDAVDMEADNGSAGALVPLTVVNNREIHVPLTGETGTWLLTSIGMAAASASLMVILAVKRKKDETTEMSN